VAEVTYNTAEGTASIPVTCSAEDSNPPAQVGGSRRGRGAQVTWLRDGAIHSTVPTITVSSQLTGSFLCTAMNSVGPALSAALTVSVREFPRRLQIEANDYRSSVRLHFPLS
jgi:hypothetical protein